MNATALDRLALAIMYRARRDAESFRPGHAQACEWLQSTGAEWAEALEDGGAEMVRCWLETMTRRVVIRRVRVRRDTGQLRLW